MEGADWQQESGAHDGRDRQQDRGMATARFACPLCKSTTYDSIPGYGAAELHLYKCSGCTLTFTNPQRFAKKAG
jgi:hypothetical protein